MTNACSTESIKEVVPTNRVGGTANYLNCLRKQALASATTMLEAQALASARQRQDSRRERKTHINIITNDFYFVAMRDFTNYGTELNDRDSYDRFAGLFCKTR